MVKIKTTNICNHCGVPYGWPHQGRCFYVENTMTQSVYVDVLGNRETCRHGTTFWCEDCVTDAYLLHSSIGKEEGLAFSIELLRSASASCYTSHKDDDAAMLRGLADKLTKTLDEVKEVTHAIRKKQMPKQFK